MCPVIVMYRVWSIVTHSNPCPPPKSLLTDAAFAFNFSWTLLIALYVGAALILGIVGNGNVSEIAVSVVLASLYEKT